MSEDLHKLRKLATKAADIAPGAWDHDTDNNDGAYGSGPDARHGFSSYFMMDDKGRRLFDSYNSEVAEVHEDDDSAWDENSRRLFDYLAAFNPATALSLLSRLQAAEERAPFTPEEIRHMCAQHQEAAQEAEERAEKAERALYRIKEVSNPTIRIERPRLNLDRAWEIANAALKTEGA